MRLLNYIHLKFANYADPFRYRKIAGKPLTRWQRLVCWTYETFWKLTTPKPVQIPADVQKAIDELKWTRGGE